MHQIFSLAFLLCLLFVKQQGTTAFQMLPCRSPAASPKTKNISSSTAADADGSVGNFSKSDRREATVSTRRDMVTISINAMALSLALITQNPASSSALESRNESVCGTGLFEHFQEWRCTPIGNILDEGSPKDLKEGEVTSIDSLMGKLGVSMDDLNGMEVDSEKDGKKRKGPKEKSKESN